MQLLTYRYGVIPLTPAPVLECWSLYSQEQFIDHVSNRPALKALLDRCQDLCCPVVWVPFLGELADNIEQLKLRLRQCWDQDISILAIAPDSFLLERCGSTNTSPDPPLIFLSSPTSSCPFDPVLNNPDIYCIRGSDWIDVMTGFATQYRQDRIRDGHAQNRLKGLPPPGKAPHGYRRGKGRYVIDRRAAAEVKDFFEQFLLFGSLRGAVRFLEQKHHRKISVSTGQRWLTHPVYRGDLVYQDQLILSDTHKPLLSRQEAAQIDRLLRRNHRLPARSASAPRSLAGLVSCHDCGIGMMVSKVTKRGGHQEYLYLRPKTCPKAKSCSGLCYQTVLEKTIHMICDQLPIAVQDINAPAIAPFKRELEAAISVKNNALAQLPSLVDSEVLDENTAQQRAFTLKTELSALQQKLSQLPPVNLRETSQAIALPQFWFDLSETERRFYFREFLKTVAIVREGQDWSIRLEFIFG